jgi:hypothetical protein
LGSVLGGVALAINDDMQPPRDEHRQVLKLPCLFISDIQNFGDVPYIAKSWQTTPICVRIFKLGEESSKKTEEIKSSAREKFREMFLFPQHIARKQKV